MVDTFPPANSAILLNTGSAIKEGDTKTIFQIKLLDVNDQPVDLTGSTVKAYFSRPDNTYLFEKEVTLSPTPTDGIVSFKFTSTDTTGTGIINVQLNVTYSDSSIEKFPSNNFINLFVEESNDNLTNFATVSFSTFNDVQNEIQESALASIVSIHQELNNEDETLQTNINTVQSNLATHESSTNNPHSVTKSQVGLGNVDNTADVDKPISTSTQTALDAKVDDSDTTTIATANKLLYLDSNGNLPTSITGNSETSTKLETPRTISLSGDATGSILFDGSSDETITVALVNSGATAGTYTKLTIDSKGRVTSATNLSATDIPNLDWAKITTGKPITLSGYGITDGVNSSDVVTTATANKILKLDSNSKLPASITGNADGNAATATKLQTARTIAISGDITGTPTSFDGLSDITIPSTLSPSGVTAGTYKSVTVDTKGRVTSGTNPTTLAGYGITDAIKKYTTQIGDGSSTSFTVTHNLNTQNCVVSVYETTSPYSVVSPSSIQMTDVNTIALSFSSAPTSNQYQVVVVG